MMDMGGNKNAQGVQIVLTEMVGARGFVAMKGESYRRRT